MMTIHIGYDYTQYTLHLLDVDFVLVFVSIKVPVLCIPLLFLNVGSLPVLALPPPHWDMCRGLDTCRENDSRKFEDVRVGGHSKVSSVSVFLSKQQILTVTAGIVDVL